MALPRLVDLLVAPLRALARAQGAISRTVLEWLRGRFHTGEDGVSAPKMLGVPIAGDEDREVAIPTATLVPPPGLELGESRVAFELEIVQTERRTASPGAPIAFLARPSAGPRARPNRRPNIRMEVTLRPVEPGRALRKIEERLSDPGGWRARGGAGSARRSG